MPKRVDRDVRRRQIAEAVWRLASHAGLEQVTLRQVAAEAGVSMRLVQYYFGTRHQLLVGALEILNDEATLQAQQRVAALERDPTPRGVIRGVLVELLPLDEQRRNRYLIYIAYFVHSLSDDDLAATFRNAPPGLETLVAELIAWGQDTDAIPGDLDPQLEAELLISSIDGMQTAIILGQRTADRTLELIDHQLDRIFTPPSERLGRRS